MRFHCNRCNKDFTTLSEDKGKKFAFRHFMLDRMSCPHCGAINASHVARKPMKQTRLRWQPKRRSMDTDDYSPPAIVLHEVCRKRLSGNPMSIEGMEVVCEGCPSAFNCFTGNVDDGSLKSKEYALDALATRAKERLEAVEEAKEKVAEKKRNDEKEFLEKLRLSLGKVGFYYQFQNEITYAQFQGTVWKLDDADTTAILKQTWDTQKTMIIRNTLNKRGIKPIMAQKLLYWENWCRKN